MSYLMRTTISALLVLGILGIVFGVIFIVQAGSAEQTIASEISPVKLSEVDAKYDTVKEKQIQMAQAEEPNIQAGKAAPSATYIYLSGQRTSLGLAKANIGTVAFVRTNGIIDIVIGLGLILAAMGLIMKSASAAKVKANPINV